MRRILALVLMAGGLWLATGCVAVSAKNNRFASDHAAVVVDGRVYVINTRNGAVREVDLATARPMPFPDEDDDCD